MQWRCKGALCKHDATHTALAAQHLLMSLHTLICATKRWTHRVLKWREGDCTAMEWQPLEWQMTFIFESTSLSSPLSCSQVPVVQVSLRQDETTYWFKQGEHQPTQYNTP